MLTVAAVASTLALASAQSGTTKQVPLGFKGQIDNLEGIADYATFEITQLSAAAIAAVNATAPIYLGYTFGMETSSATVDVTGAEVEANYWPCAATAAAAMTDLAGGYNATLTGTGTSPSIDLGCTYTASQTSAFVTYELTAAPVSSLDNTIDDSWLYYYDSAMNMFTVPTFVAKDNEAFQTYPLDTTGALFPAIYYPDIAVRPWVKVEYSLTASGDADVAFCVTSWPIVEGDGYTWNDCTAAVQAATPTVAALSSTTAGDDYVAGLTIAGKQNDFTGDWFVTPFVAVASSTGDFKVAIADGHEPISAAGVAPTVAVFAVVAALANYLH